MSDCFIGIRGYVQRIKLRKVFYHFAIFAIINKILIAENWSSIIFYSNIINFTEKLQEMKIVYFFLIELYEFFQNFLSTF